MIIYPNESRFETTTIDRLKLLCYKHEQGNELRENPNFSLEAVVLVDVLCRHLRAQYPQLPDDAIETAIQIATNPDGVNSFCVISDGTTTLHGMHSASLEWLAPWKTIDGRHIEPITTSSMKTLIEGLFPKDRLLDYIRHFILFEMVNNVITKKGAKYHQFFGVRFAVKQALHATKPDGDRRIGVIWHTQGSGKSLSMIFFVGILQQKLENPTFIIQVDRNDLDKQQGGRTEKTRYLCSR